MKDMKVASTKSAYRVSVLRYLRGRPDGTVFNLNRGEKEDCWGYTLYNDGEVENNGIYGATMSRKMLRYFENGVKDSEIFDTLDEAINVAQSPFLYEMERALDIFGYRTEDSSDVKSYFTNCGLKIKVFKYTLNFTKRGRCINPDDPEVKLVALVDDAKAA